MGVWVGGRGLGVGWGIEREKGEFLKGVCEAESQLPELRINMTVNTWRPAPL